MATWEGVWSKQKVEYLRDPNRYTVTVLAREMMDKKSYKTYQLLNA
jgi:hypothetical protein